MHPLLLAKCPAISVVVFPEPRKTLVNEDTVIEPQDQFFILNKILLISLRKIAYYLVNNTISLLFHSDETIVL